MGRKATVAVGESLCNNLASEQTIGRDNRMRHRAAGLATASIAAAGFVAASAVDRSAGSPTTSPASVFMDIAAGKKETKQKTVMVEVPPPRWRVTAADLAAGAAAGASVELALYPIDTIKTQLQAMRKGGGMMSLLREGKGKGLYAGVWGNLVGVIPASAIFFAVYEPLKRTAEGWVPEHKTLVGPIVAGAGAGIAASVVRVPTEVVKQRMQIGEFKSAVSAIGSIVQNQGVRGMYAGYGSFLLRDLPFDAIEFLAYEQFKAAYTRVVQRELTSPEVSVIGAAAGGVTGVATTPLDVLKTRLMTQGTKAEYSGIVHCATKIMQEEGPGAFLKGWQPRVLWIGVGGSVFFTALEISKKAFKPEPQYIEVPATK